MNEAQGTSLVKFACFTVFVAITMFLTGSFIFAVDHYLTSRNPEDEYLTILIASQIMSPLLGFLVGLAIRSTIFAEYEKVKARYLVTFGIFLSLLQIAIFFPVVFPTLKDLVDMTLELAIFLALILPCAIFYAAIGALIAALVLRLP